MRLFERFLEFLSDVLTREEVCCTCGLMGPTRWHVTRCRRASEKMIFDQLRKNQKEEEKNARR